MTFMSRNSCLICSADLERPPTGRPPTYCSKTCRRAAELEIRRAGRRLEWLEQASSNWRLQRGEKKQLARLEAEHERVTGRLLALLDGLPDAVSPTPPNPAP
jgi:hypothetical protein